MFRALKGLFMSNRPDFLRISPQAARQQVESEPSTLIIDVREPDEVAASAVPGAINIPRGVLGREITHVVPEQDTPVMLCCAAGGRAALCAQTLVELGYTNVKMIDASHREILQAFRG